MYEFYARRARVVDWNPMDISAIIDQVTASIAEAPAGITELAADPRGFVEGVVGQLPEGVDLASVLEGVQANLGSIDFTGVDLGGLDIQNLDLAGALEGFGIADGFDFSAITDAVDFSAVSDALPGGIGDAVGAATEGGIGEVIGGLLGGLFGKK